MTAPTADRATVGGGATPGRGWTLAAAGLGALLLAPTLAYRLGLDQGVFAYIGGELLDGRWPYLATWDHAWPGMMYLNALEIGLLGRSIPAFRLFDLVWQIATLVLIHRIAWRLAGRAGALVALCLYALTYQGYGPWNTAQREGFATLFAMAGLALQLEWGERRPLAVAAAVGLGLGIAATFKPTLLAFAAIYAPLWLRPRRRAPALVAVAGVGVALPLAGFVALYAALGGLRELYEATVAYQTTVYVDHLRGDLSAAAWALERLRHLGLTTQALTLGYLPFLFFGPHRRERLAVYLGYLGCVFAVWLQGTFAGYHYLPALALGAVLSGSAFALALERVWPDRPLALGSRGVSRHVLVAAGVGLALVPLYVHPEAVSRLVRLQFLGPPAPGELRIDDVFDFTEDWEAARYLAAHTRPGDRIQVWGHESLVYYLAQRSAASRFQTSNPLVMRPPEGAITPMQERWRAEFLDAVDRQRPPYVVVVTGDHWWWAPGRQTSEELLDEFPAWRDRIRRDYALEHRAGRLEIYRRVER